MWFEVGGARVFSQTGGRSIDPLLPTVVMIHGAGMDQTIWQQQSRYLAHHGWNVLAIDLPGHGRSSGIARSSVSASADWLINFLDAAELETVALVGHSLGALISLDAAGRHGDRVSRAALLGVTPKMPVHQALLDAAAENRRLASQFIVGWGFSKEAHRGGNIASGLWMMEGGRRLLEQTSPGVLAADLRAANGYNDGLKVASKVKCPVMLLLGASDKMTPVKGVQKLELAVANCRIKILPGVGHMMMIEEPRQTLKSIAGFLNEAL